MYIIPQGCSYKVLPKLHRRIAQDVQQHYKYKGVNVAQILRLHLYIIQCLLTNNKRIILQISCRITARSVSWRLSQVSTSSRNDHRGYQHLHTQRRKSRSRSEKTRHNTQSILHRNYTMSPHKQQAYHNTKYLVTLQQEVFIETFSSLALVSDALR